MRKQMIFIFVIILSMSAVQIHCLGVSDLLGKINYYMSPMNYKNAEKVTEKIQSLNDLVNDYQEIKINGSERILNKDAAFHCYKMNNRQKYQKIWMDKGTEAVFNEAIEITIVPICDDETPSGYVILSEKKNGSSIEIAYEGSRMSGKAYMSWMEYIVDKDKLVKLLTDNEIASITDLKCVLGREEQEPDFIYISTDIGEYVIPYFTAGEIDFNGELIALDSFLASYDNYVKSVAADLLPNYFSAGGGSLKLTLIWGTIFLVGMGTIITIVILVFKKRKRKIL